ncbi:metalloprotease TIKI2 [Cynoglossus semilaevis]|uniref:Metalloprotease TIKI n=1 Tax=Cynoglossus semilaevis TaxID=244447 RepID=A0A3P8UIB7_CYNSE|nr:metalloprotease TIKI2-like [Cynoglossus semilaevis]XP_008334548.1 metalloprotease TIKI2-like [Cynoglossus semilaevis]XP_024921010.1 metalloprotease TIKI2-like [Cynoglossus semilaevis]
MVYLPGLSWVLLSALLHTVAPWGAERPDRPRQCRVPQSQSDMNSFLWMVKRPAPHPPSYLFGTIHVPYTRVWDFIPNSTKEAFHNSRNVFFELDLTDPLTISKLTSCQLLPHGENLQTLLPRDLYRRLKRHLDYVKHMMPYWMTADQRGRGLYADYLFNAIAGNWERKRPVWVMLMVNSLTEWDVRSRGTPVLDLFLAQEAEGMGKMTGAVERVEEQCHPLNGLNFSQVLFALNQTLLQHEGVRAGSLQGSYTTEDLITHYNCGDLSSIIFNHDTSQLPHFINSSLPAHDRMTALQIDSYFRQELIYKRNERMARRVSALLQRNPNQTYFFAFGAGHFLGNHSVLDILRQEGYEIMHMSADHQETESRPAAGSSEETAVSSTAAPTSWSTSPSEVELGDPEDIPGLEDEELPHMLLPDSLSQLEEFGRHKRPRKGHRGHGRPRLFSDLWVRIGDGTTPTPNVRIINNYVTVEPPLTHQEQRRLVKTSTEQQPSPSPRPSSAETVSRQSSLTLSCLLAWILSHVLFTS